MKTVTVKEFADAIRKNGLEQTKGAAFRNERGKAVYLSHGLMIPEGSGSNKIVEACALGQAFINLGCHREATGGVLYNRISALVIDMNDTNYATFDEIADAVEEKFADRLDETMTFHEYDYSPYLSAQ